MSGIKRNILISGASGQVGSAVIRALKDDPSINLIAAGRSEEKAARLGVAWRKLDYDDLSTLSPALQDIESVFMVTDYTVGMLRQSKALINSAKRAGVGHIVHLGAPGDDDTNVDHWGWHQFVERYIEWSGFSFTHLRPEIFMQNLLGYGGAKPIQEGVIHHYVGDAKICWVDIDDIAAVAAECLREPFTHRGQTYRLGYDAKTYHEVAAILATATRQHFRYEARPAAEFLEKVLAAGADYAYMQCAHNNYYNYATGKTPGADYTFDNFETITGRKPTRWEDFAARHKQEFLY
jgi:uncharacterized protein YbjT (DUF2867 family)